MLTDAEIKFMHDMTMQLHKETGQDRYVIADKLRALYHPNVAFSYREIAAICHVTRDKVRRIEQLALEKLHHPLTAPLLEGYDYE